ncbi:serine/threonine-protein kinase [Streptomyces netropsis]|uniref:serine/threonine-protein kinase n=1 Tax=Streptomyces netropsis TaxID=55404 RepID=UPI00227D7A40|nr:serine/threonine-protein kinase [Streptomyces netropsis]
MNSLRGGALGAREEGSERVVGGRYRLVGQLGSGGFGRVWKAYDEMLDVDVAVKEVWLPQQAASASGAEHRERVVRAAREARNAAKLRDHPHIVAVHDVVVEDGTPWIVMRLVEGRSLEERLRTDGPLPVPRAAEVAAALLKALKAAHAAGIVHRDLKPANVMLTDDGQVLLTDFGIAVHETDTKLTVTGGVIGSAEYMAPERLQGTQDQAAGDLFSLGATLYEAVEGVSPFRRETPRATMAAVALHEPPPMQRSDPVLASLITALLAKNPEDRPNVDSTLALLRAGAPTLTAAMPMPPHSRGPSAVSAALTETAAPVSRVARVGRLITGSCFLVIGLGLVAFRSTTITSRHVGSVLVISLLAAALVAVLFGLAAMFYRWKGPGKPPFLIIGGVFLPVFLPLALIWEVWNAVVLNTS